MNDLPDITLKETLRAKIRAKKETRTRGYTSTTPETPVVHNVRANQEDKVLDFRKQEEFGAKMRIKP